LEYFLLPVDECAIVELVEHQSDPGCDASAIARTRHKNLFEYYIYEDAESVDFVEVVYVEEGEDVEEELAPRTLL
jgi:hypothetical protein